MIKKTTNTLWRGGSAAFIGLVAASAAVPGLSFGPPAPKTPDGASFYETKVKPILTARCLTCHTGAGGSGGLDMTDRAAIIKGGVTGPAVNLTKTSDSLILRFINYHETRKMPPQGKIPQPEIDALTKWVAMGLPMAKPTTDHGPRTTATAPHGIIPPKVNAETKNFWAFRPVKRPAVPTPKKAGWVRNPVDAFVLAKLEANGLKPAPPLGKIALLRRVTYDLIGLPPTPEEVQAFVADASPKAYEKAVDRLLASPHYGERWGRHWLDLVRYAESNSFERDGTKPFVWRYRDYVIRSFNSDKPYDQFVKEQLAGDELDTVTAETITATGYYRLGQWDDEPADPEQARFDELDDILATTGQTMLGLTVNCARCHDHKIDPVPQKDYYRMLAFFRGVRRYGEGGVENASLRVIATDEEKKRFAAATAEWQAKADAVQKPISAVEDKVAATFVPVEVEEFRDEAKRPELIKKRIPKLLSETEFADYQKLVEKRNALRDTPPPGLTKALAVTENSVAAPGTHVLLRGNPHVPAAEVYPGFPSVLSPPEPEIKANADGSSSGRRRALAEWIVSPTNPLTARVMANRLFQYHFGRGIVRSSSNFGKLGNTPTHPELLDYLATELVRQNWRLKPMHRMLVLSNAYRMSSQGDKVALSKDPENDLLWRFDMRRLDAEEIRDSVLAVNGTLNPTLYGPSVYPKIEKEVLAGQSVPGANWQVNSGPEQQSRRAIYTHIKRSLPLPILASFDAAETDFTCPVRFATTQPTQALTMLNSAFLNAQAANFAALLQSKAGDAPEAQVKSGLWRTLQRPPTPKEIARGVAFLKEMQNESGIPAKEALRRYCLVLLNLNEFVYLD